MVKRWLTKIKTLLKQNEDDSFEQEENKRSRTQPEIQAKMKYQYPEKNAFRFPVIPDKRQEEVMVEHKPKVEKKVEEPAYQRRKKERQARPKVIEQTQVERIEHRPRKIYKDQNAPPFQLTEIPSPIYGFQKPEKEIEEIPAYQRKQTEDTIENKNVNLVQTKAEVIEEGSTVKTEKQEKKVVIEQEVAQIDPHETEEKQAIQTKQQSAKEVNGSREHRQKSARAKQRNSRRGRNRSKENQLNQERAIPYNVMMTPNDRLQYEKKQQELQQKQMNQVEQEINHSAPEKTAPEKPEEGSLYIPMHLLNDPIPVSNENDRWIEEQQHLLEETLLHFHVNAKVVKATQGPSVTRFEVQPEMGVKVSKIKNLSDDLKLNMSASDIRIEAPIPGKNTVGIEIPNKKARMVGLQEIFETDAFKENESALAIALGLDIEGEPKVTNIQKMPHGLIAGATGSGKSVCINSILISILYKASHEDVKFLLIDPKMVELAPYNGIPHLVAPVITDVKAATQSLKWAVNEMEERYERFVEESVRDIHRYNEKVISLGRKDEKMPYIVIVIDELADLMMMSPQDVETSISRIAQKARACGIHLLLATQRPSVDVITGLIKANIPTRIAFSVSSQVDSRTIIDTGGAEQLLGKGDMLFSENGTNKTVRLQGPFVSDDEIERVTSYVRQIAEPNYLFEQEQLLAQIEFEEDSDELLEAAIEFVQHQQSASTSMLQRHFKIGYNRAARLIDTMEASGIIAGQNGSKPREVFITENHMS